MKIVRKQGPALSEIGATSVKINSGVVMDEYTPALQGERSRRVYREMRDNDPTVGGALALMESLVCSIDWTFKIAGDSDYTIDTLEQEAIDWISGVLFTDMESSWDQFLVDALSMLTYGWSWFEIVYKIRKGNDVSDPRYNSLFSDNTVGIRKFAFRNQDALDDWIIDGTGDVLGINYTIYDSQKQVFLPASKSVHFRTCNNGGNPEGRSILRNAYKSWFFLNNIQVTEAVGIERNLSGLPAIYMPGETLNGDDADSRRAVEAYKKIIQNLRFNERAGLLLPSDTYLDQDGNPTAIPKVRFELLSCGGQRAVDTNTVSGRYEKAIARSMMADFIMLGNFRQGSYALSTDKTDMFEKAMMYLLNNVAETINRQVIRRLWKLNAFDPNYMPYLVPGRVSQESVQAMVDLVESLARAGAPIFPDDDLENDIRRRGGLPPVPKNRDELLSMYAPVQNDTNTETNDGEE